MKGHRVVVLAMLLGLLAVDLPAWPGRVLNDHLVTNPFSHHIWQEVLSEHVDGEGHVDFNRIRAYPRRMNEYLDQLAAASPDSRPALFPNNQARMAYWINAHNALALRLVLDRYPVKRLEGIPGFRRNARYKLGGVPYSIEALQDKIAQTYYWNPAICCGLSDLSLGSPPLLNQAYRPDALEGQLLRRAENFIRAPGHVTLSAPCGTITLSPVFRQFRRPLTRYVREEAGDREGGLAAFIKLYLEPERQALLAGDCPRPVTFQPFDNRLRRLPDKAQSIP
jgi:hypothetical protein